MLFQIIILIIFTCACCTVFYKSTEHFWFVPPSTKIENNDGTGNECINLNRHECKRQASCGLCTLTNGEKQCVGGDWNGPLNGQDCVQYEYGNYYANLSLVDPEQPYWSNPNLLIDWKKPIYNDKNNEPHPSDEGDIYFKRGSPPKNYSF
jgi:hypothetical protein